MKNFLYIAFLLGSWYSQLVDSSDFYSKNGYYKDQGFLNDFVNHRYGDRHNIGDILRNKQFDFTVNFNKSKGIFERNSYRFGFDDGNPDVHGRIERPCQAYDTFCIRKFFAEHSRCKISGRRLPDPFYRAQGTADYPSANMSVIIDSVLYGGLNAARVEEFFIDKVTDNLVIAIYFDAITLAGNDTNLKFYLRGREPEVHQGFGSLLFEQITITVIIPGLDDLRLDRAEIFTYAENPLLPYAVSPKLLVSSDPEVVAMGVFFATVNIETEHLEELSTEGVFFSANYIQYNICDFGLKAL